MLHLAPPAGVSSVTSQVIEIPNGPEVNFVIGRGGASINAIQMQTGTHVNIQRASEVAVGALSRQVTISGTEEAIGRCVALIHQRVGEYAAEMGGGLAVPSVHEQVDPSEQVVLNIPNGPEVNHVIGAKGASINALQAETGTHIAIQRATDVLPGVTTRTVIITGADAGARRRCADLVRAKVLEYSGAHGGGMPEVSGGASSSSAVAAGVSAAAAAAAASAVAGALPAVTVTTVAASREQTVLQVPNGPEVNFLIGAKGASINAIQAETGAHVSVQKASEVAPGAKTRTVTITGAEAQRARCAELVRQRVAEYALEYPDADGQPSAKRRRAAPPPQHPYAAAYPPTSHFGYPPPHYGPPHAYAPPPPGYAPPPPAAYAPPPPSAASGPPPGYPYATPAGPSPYGPPPTAYPPPAHPPPMHYDLSQFNPHAYPPPPDPHAYPPPADGGAPPYPYPPPPQATAPAGAQPPYAPPPYPGYGPPPGAYATPQPGPPPHSYHPPP